MYAPALCWEQWGFLLSPGCWVGTLALTPLVGCTCCHALWATVATGGVMFLSWC